MKHVGNSADNAPNAEIGDDFALTAASQIRRQALLLFAGFSISIPGVIALANPAGSTLVGLLIPLAILAFALVGVCVLLRYPAGNTSPLAARKLLGHVGKLTITIVVLGSLWCLESWLEAPHEARIYYPLIMALGGYATGFCIAPLRKTATFCVVIPFLPNGLLLISSGERMDIISGCTMLLAAGFQLMLIENHSKILKELLGHRSQARELARIDSLTGLINRRALLADINHQRSSSVPKRLMVVDIDNFKAVNDTFGHDIGDQVLREIGGILSRYVAANVSVARIGGEEFALFGPVHQLPEALALKILTEIRNASMVHKQQVTVSIGIADGPAACEQSWRALYARADAQLYAAKDAGRNQIMSEDLPSESKAKEELAA